MLNKASIICPLPAVGFSCCRRREGWGAQPCPVPCLLLESRCSSRWEHELPFRLAQSDLHSLLIYSLATFIFPSEIPKRSHAKPRSHQPLVILKQPQHHSRVLATGSRSQLPVRLQVFVLLGTERVADRLALPRPHCGTRQQGKNRKGFKNYRKKQPHSLQMKLQNRTTSLLNGILVFAKPTTFANRRWVTVALSPQPRASGEEAVLAAITSAQVVPPAQHLCFQGLKDRTRLHRSANEGRAEAVHGGLGLYLTPRDLPAGPSTANASVLHPCHG